MGSLSIWRMKYKHLDAVGDLRAPRRCFSYWWSFGYIHLTLATTTKSLMEVEIRRSIHKLGTHFKTLDEPVAPPLNNVRPTKQNRVGVSYSYPRILVESPSNIRTE
jgi:hypothetical protein